MDALVAQIHVVTMDFKEIFHRKTLLHLLFEEERADELLSSLLYDLDLPFHGDQDQGRNLNVCSTYLQLEVAILVDKIRHPLVHSIGKRNPGVLRALLDLNYRVLSHAENLVG